MSLRERNVIGGVVGVAGAIARRRCEPGPDVSGGGGREIGDDEGGPPICVIGGDGGGAVGRKIGVAGGGGIVGGLNTGNAGGGGIGVETGVPRRARGRGVNGGGTGVDAGMRGGGSDEVPKAEYGSARPPIR